MWIVGLDVVDGVTGLDVVIAGQPLPSVSKRKSAESKRNMFEAKAGWEFEAEHEIVTDII